MKNHEKTAFERLVGAEAALREGRYKEALDEFVWFHEKVLEVDPAQHGVRLSYALRGWARLAEVYADAAVALFAVRDAKTTRLYQGEGDFELFNDVLAINHATGDEYLSYLLIAELAEANAIPAGWAPQVLEVTVLAGDFALAEKFIGETAPWVRELCRRLNQGLDQAAAATRGGDIRAYAETSFFIDRLRLLLETLDARGRGDEKAPLRALAVSLIVDVAAKQDVFAELNAPNLKVAAALRRKRLPTREREAA